MAITWVNTTTLPQGLSPNLFLAAAYESRATTIARLFVPLASFAGDTSQTLTDGSFNSNPGSILKSSSANLANPSNILNTGNVTNNALGDFVSAKPLVIKVQRDPFTGEINDYGVFNADGTFPGAQTAAAPFGKDPNYDPFTGPNRRYVVNRLTGEIYLARTAGITGINLDTSSGADILTGAAGTDNVVGIVEFKALEGAALSSAQQAASELSNVIQSLATLIRGIKESDRTLLNTVR